MEQEQRKPRFASKQEAEQYLAKAESQKNYGLKYWACCDFLGVTNAKIAAKINAKKAH
jgi:hypothetical protein